MFSLHFVRVSPRAALARAAILGPAVLAAFALPARDIRAQGGTPVLLTTAPAGTMPAALFGGLAWRNVGPNRGGRSIAVAGTGARPLEYYFGATGGGVWKTTDAGSTWNPVGDGQFATSSVGAVAQCEADPDVVWAGMGEVAFRGNVIPGDGVYRSTDAGRTWRHMGLASSTGQQMVARIRIDPANCNRVFVAVLGDPFGPNDERGVYRTTDGGASWTRVLHRNRETGAVDLVIDPSDSQTLYVGMWQAYRKEWLLSSGGPGSGLFKSTDGGTTWTELTANAGLPRGLWGKVGVSVSGADRNRVYAIIEADSGGVFASDDAGASWRRVNDSRNLRQRAFYYTRLVADPRDKETVYVLNVQFFRSRDGGQTFQQVGSPHSDNHDLWIAPNDPMRMVQSNDGGANVSWNGGATWTGQAYPTAQMYDVRVTNHFPYHICGGQQDNSTACVPMDGDGSYFYAPGGCETGPVTPHPGDVNLFYAACYGGSMSFMSRITGQQRAVNVWPVNPMGNSAVDLKERFQWNHPITASTHDTRVVYVGSQHVWRSSDGGESWTRISDDLTWADPATLGPSGGDITRDQTSVEYYGTVWRITESPHAAGELWVGSDDGKVHLTRNDGGAWTDITPPDLPKFSRVHEIDVSPHTPGKAYIAAVRYRSQDVNPYVYRTTDYGRTWTKITNGIPDGHYVRTIREDLKRPGLLYAGTERGVLVSFDDGASWQSLQLNLPAVQVPGLVLKDDDVVIATHGRSYWVLENVAPLRQAAAAISARAVHLYAPTPAVRTLSRVTEPYTRRKSYLPEFDYYLGRAADTVRIAILDARGTVIREYTGTAAAAGGAGGGRGGAPGAAGGGGRGGAATPVRVSEGHTRFSWDMRYPGPRDFPGLIMWSANTQGPLAPPGRYQIRLTAHGESYTQPFEITADPRLTNVTQADFDAQFRLSSQVAARVDDAHRAVLQVRDVRGQVDDRLGRNNNAALRREASAFKESIAAIEQEIYQVRMQASQDPLNYPIKLNNQLAALRGIIESADARPTAQSQEAFTFLSGQLDVQLGKLQEAFDRDLTRLNNRLRGLGLAPIVVPPLRSNIVF
jgi:photosystem II stability/assembly factor-like uncharacterized protein